MNNGKAFQRDSLSKPSPHAQQDRGQRTVIVGTTVYLRSRDSISRASVELWETAEDKRRDIVALAENLYKIVSG